MTLYAVRITLARLHQQVGVPGVVGLTSALVAVVIGASSWHEHRRFEPLRAGMPSAAAVDVPQPRKPVVVPLRPAGDVPLLLARMERSASEQELGWPRADYRINPASDDAPASLEVRCTLKGPYPRIRRFVTALLQDTPTLTLREFSLTRASAEANDVEAKLGIVVYLASGVRAATDSTGSTR